HSLAIPCYLRKIQDNPPCDKAARVSRPMHGEWSRCSPTFYNRPRPFPLSSTCGSKLCPLSPRLASLATSRTAGGKGSGGPTAQGGFGGSASGSGGGGL